MKRFLALTGVLCAPLSILGASMAVPKVLGILLALLQLGSNIGFGSLITLYTAMFAAPFFLWEDVLFIL
ncbi:MAG: hypothetical protein HY650_12505 [Acidobacteria bacterium]|nr:hypothetical protein [Acidobacteriota bacterium]